MICAIVLAAGRSQRMGTQKLLLPWGNKSVVAHVIDEVLRSPVQQVFVVIGQDGEQIKGALMNRCVTCVSNPDSEGDMLSSVRCGLQVLPAACDGVLIVLGDQPKVTTELVAEMVSAFHQHRGIIVPVHQGRCGHPVLFSKKFCEEVMSCHDGIGLRGLLCSHVKEVFELPVPASGVLEDMDTPQDYERLVAR
jgi:molybdenum cofactor cytidylyltransferase